MRQDLQIDAGLIHLADAQLAEIIEPLNDIATRARTRTELLDLRVLVMFFKRDDVGLLCHSCPLSYASRQRCLSGQRLPARASGSPQSLFSPRRSPKGSVEIAISVSFGDVLASNFRSLSPTTWCQAMTEIEQLRAQSPG